MLLRVGGVVVHEGEPQLAMRPREDRLVVAPHQRDRSLEEVLGLLREPFQPLDPRHLVQRPDQVRLVRRVLEDLDRVVELGSSAGEISLPAGHVPEREVRAGCLGLEVPVPVHLVRATEGALRVDDPPLVEEEPGHVHVHLGDAERVGEMRGERHELGSRFRRLVGDAGFQVREDERGVEASERVGIAELLSLQTVEEALEEEDRVPHVTQRFEAPRLARDRVDPLGGGFVLEQILRILVMRERLFRLRSTLVPQGEALFRLRSDPGEVEPLGVLRDRSEQLLGFVRRPTRQRHHRLLEAELEPRFQIGRSAREELVGGHAEPHGEVLDRLSGRRSAPGFDRAHVRVAVLGVGELLLRHPARQP